MPSLPLYVCRHIHCLCMYAVTLPPYACCHLHCLCVHAVTYTASVFMPSHTQPLYVCRHLHCLCMYAIIYTASLCMPSFTLPLYVCHHLHCLCVYAITYTVSVCMSSPCGRVSNAVAHNRQKPNFSKFQCLDKLVIEFLGARFLTAVFRNGIILHRVSYLALLDSSFPEHLPLSMSYITHILL